MSVRWEVHIPLTMQRHSGSAKAPVNSAAATSDTPGDIVRMREAPADREPDAVTGPQPQA